MKLAAVFGVIVIAALTGLQDTAARSARTNSGVLVFQLGNDVMEASVDGSGAARISPPSLVEDFAVSPDERRIAYTAYGPRTGEAIIVQDLKAGAARWQVAVSRWISSPAQWSADGTEIAFVNDVALEVADVRTHRLRRVAFGDGDFAWAPSGRTLAYAGTKGIVIYDAASETRRTLPGSEGASLLSWSPDGGTLAFSGAHKAILVAPRLSSPTVLASGGGANFSWAPDGTAIAFTASCCHRRDTGLWLKPLDGSSSRLLAKGAYELLAWSPNGRLLAYTRAWPTPDSPRRVISVLAPDGSHRQTFPETLGIGSQGTAWSPDGTRIAYLKRGLHVLTLATRVDTALLGDDPEPAGWDVTWLKTAPTLPALAKPIPAAADSSTDVNEPAYRLAVDGTVAATVGVIDSGVGYEDDSLVLWSPNTSAAEPSIACHYGVDNVAVAGDRFAYLCDSGDPDEENDVYMATLGNTKAPGPIFSVAYTSSLAGSGDLIVATNGGNVVRVEPSGAQTLLRAYPSAVFVRNVDRDRALLSVSKDELDVVDRDGAIVSIIHAAHSGGAVLDGDRVACLDNGRLSILDLAGVEVARDALPPAAELEDMHNDTLLYAAYDRQHLLRIGGHDVSVLLPGQMSDAWGRFADDGSVFFAWNTNPRSSRLAHAGAMWVSSVLG